MGCIGSSTTKTKPKVYAPIKAGVKQLRQQYTINPKVLGAGSFGKVFQAEDKYNPEHKVAIKVISKSKLSPDEINELRDEVAILQSLDHPNIVKYFETYDDVKYIYLVMELCSGGELIEKVSEKSYHFSELKAAQVLQKLVRALMHCHANNIIHRDIKPENIMFGNDGEVKLIDFGLAKQQSRKGQSMHTIAGTPYFIAPEVLSGSYSKECDIWSFGVLLYLILSGKYPFDANNRTELFDKIKRGDFTFPQQQFKHLSEDCKDLIRQMICVDRKKRISCEKILEHPWMTKVLGSQEGHDVDLDPEIISNLKKFKGQSMLKKAALNVLVKMLGPKDIQRLREQFQRLDADNSGCLEISELEQAIKNANLDLTAKEIRAIVDELDYDGNHSINYSEFLAATISVHSILTHERLEAIFKQFDIDNTNEITAGNIRDAMTKLGKEISDQELEEIMLKHDVSGDKAISFDEFKKMMLSEDIQL